MADPNNDPNFFHERVLDEKLASPQQSVVVTARSFTGSSSIYDAGPKGLAAMLRGMAIDNARTRIETSAFPDLTDNSTGTANVAGMVDLVVPGPFDASAQGAAGAAIADVNTALTAIRNAQQVLAVSLNAARTVTGRTLIVATEGTVATANTIPAQPKTVGAAPGVAAVDYATGAAALSCVRSNQRKLLRAMNHLMTNLGFTSVVDGFKVSSLASDYNLTVIPPAVAAASPGSRALAQADVNAFLLASANNVATLAARWNAVMAQGATKYPLSVVAG